MYNKWLQCPEIQELTETEPCSLKEEFSYQKEWEQDNQQTSKVKAIYEAAFHQIFKIDKAEREW